MSLVPMGMLGSLPIGFNTIKHDPTIRIHLENNKEFCVIDSEGPHFQFDNYPTMTKEHAAIFFLDMTLNRIMHIRNEEFNSGRACLNLDIENKTIIQIYKNKVVCSIEPAKLSDYWTIRAANKLLVDNKIDLIGQMKRDIEAKYIKQNPLDHLLFPST